MVLHSPLLTIHYTLHTIHYTLHAIHYRELEFETSPATCFESLININKKLDQYDAAMGVLKVVGQLRVKHPELADSYKVQESWLAKLGHWDDALVGCVCVSLYLCAHLFFCYCVCLSISVSFTRNH